MERNFHIRRYKRIIKYPQQYDPIFGAARDCDSGDVASIVNMIQDGGFDINTDTDYILLLLNEWDTDYCIDMP